MPWRGLAAAGFAVLLLLLLACLPGAALAQGPRAGTFETVLRPVRTSSTEVTAIAVRSVIHGAEVAAGQRFGLTAPVVYANVFGVADRVTDLVVSDAAGVISMRVEDDAPVPGGFPYYRHWRAERDVTFPVTITYHSLVQPVSQTRGPPFGIRPAAGGVSGAGSGFLVLPENVAIAASSVRWDLGDLEHGSIAASSFGDGDFTLEGPASALWQGWYMAGPAERYPGTGNVGGFSATWLGTPPWNPYLEMAHAARIFAYLGEAFPHVERPRFRVFVRILDTPPFGGGTALTNSFMISRGPARPDEGPQGPQGLLFHEMIHRFTGQIEGPAGVTSWFSEGLTSYYTTLLQLRGGFTTLDQYEQSITRLAQAYYTNVARNWSARRIVEVGFGNEDIRRLVYHRGQLYFADLDSRIRAASGGARNLDTVMREIFERREQGWRFDHDAWIDIVTREAGPEAAETFRSVIIEGSATLVPASDAFGPCFSREPATFTVESRQVEGYRWARVAAVPDSQCGGGQAS